MPANQRPSANNAGSNRIIWLSVLGILTIFLLLLSVFPGLASPSIMLLLVVAMTVCGVAAVWNRYRAWGIGDPLFLFTGIYLVYNVSVFTEITIYALAGAESFHFITENFTIVDFTLAGTASCLGAVGLLAAALLLPGPKRRTPPTQPLLALNAPRLQRTLFALGLFTVAGTMLLIALIIISTSGIAEFLSTARASEERYNYNRLLGLGIPTPSFFIAGFACMIVPLFSMPSRMRTILFGAVLFAFTLFNLVQGSRHQLAYVALMLLGAYATLGLHGKVQVRRVAWLAVGLYAAFAMFAQARLILPALFSGTLSDQSSPFLSFSWQTFLPSNNEFAGPYMTLLDTLAYPPVLQWGWTYLYAFLSIPPTRFYPGIKLPSIAVEFAANIGERFPVYAGSGFGFSPVAEAYINFRFLGIVPLFLLFGLAWHFVGRLRVQGLLGLLVYLTIVTEVMNLNRISLDGATQEMFFSVLCVVVLYAVGVVLAAGKPAQVHSTLAPGAPHN